MFYSSMSVNKLMKGENELKLRRQIERKKNADYSLKVLHKPFYMMLILQPLSCI